MILHPNPVPQHRPTRKGTGGINGNDPDPLARLTKLRNQPINQGTFTRPGRAGNANPVGLATAFLDLGHQRHEVSRAVFDHRNEPGEGQTVAGEHFFEKNVRHGVFFGK